MNITGADLIALIESEVSQVEDRLEAMLSWKRDTLALMFNFFATALSAIVIGVVLALLTQQLLPLTGIRLFAAIGTVASMTLLSMAVVLLYNQLRKTKVEYIDALQQYRRYKAFLE